MRYLKQMAVLPLLLFALILTGCSKNNDDVIWDIYPVVLFIQVSDASGGDLLDAENPNNILSDSIKAIYDGKEYPLNLNTDTKAYMPQFYGLRKGFTQTTDGRYYIEFGELEGAASYDYQQIIIDWGNGTQNEIGFTRKFRWKKGNPDVEKHFFQDGKEVSDMPFVFIK